HTILDYDGCMPSFVHITDGKQHESKIAKNITFPKGCLVVVDRSYVDYAWMNVLDSNQCFFITRSKSNMKYTVVRSFQSEALKDSGVLEDQIIELDGDAKKHYQGKKMRLVRFWDSINNAEYEFLTNNFTSNLVNFIRLNIFVKIDLWKWANDPFFSGKPPDKSGQFKLF
ncbi:transposase, partial [Sphingobacterium composti Ten et al. 2007 non Yoo et al. 2007]|uniref:transposase n=1 Tax=Sphingobacterium composti TaxID=363260 RepID=UPI001356C883